MKKMMLAVSMMLMSASMSWANLTWNFDDGTAQGWVDQSGNAASVNGSNQIWTQVQDGGSGTAVLQISGLNQTIANTSAYAEMDSVLSNNPVFAYGAYRFELTTTAGTYVGSFACNSPNSISYTDKKFNLFTDLTASSGSPALAVGDTITGLTIAAWGYSFSVSADNVDLVVPEPATIGLLMLGGLFGIRRRNRA
jgi:hypothetical protein